MKKQKLRKIYLDKQKALTESENREKSLRIKEHFFANFDFKNVTHLHLFLSILEKGEVNTSFIFNSLQDNFPNIKTIVPRVNFEKDILEHLEYNSKTKLKKSLWGINEPVGNDFVYEKEFDLVLVPLLCFDKKGFRVGYGKGFYDKFLSKCREDCLKIGLSFFEPIEEIEDIHEFDVKLNYCVTPRRLFEFGTK